MTEEDDEFDRLLRDHRTLTPEQREVLVRRAIERATAYRARAIQDVLRRLLGWIRRRTAIARLQDLDDRMLKDIGIHRSEIEAAVRGPEPFPGASVTPLDRTRLAKPRAMVKPTNGHVGRAA